MSCSRRRRSIALLAHLLHSKGLRYAEQPRCGIPFAILFRMQIH
jgi:hypothetical protein